MGRRFGSSFGLEFGARASSAIRRIAVLGESDALAARGGRAEDEPDRLGGEWAELLRLAEPRGPDACPWAARNTPLARRELPFLPGVRPAYSAFPLNR